MTTIQAPKFAIGQSVWAAKTDSIRGHWPCPDCNDTHRWAAETATGQVIPIQCPRCTGHSGNNLPRLTYQKLETSVHALTIGSVQMDTADRDGKIYRYMCKETGVGSGNVYPEGDGSYGLYESEAAAEAAAEAMRVAEQAALDSKPRALEAAAYALLPLNVALEYMWHRDIYESFALIRYYNVGIEAALGEDPDINTLEEKLYELKDSIRDRPWLKEHPVQTLINAAKNSYPHLSFVATGREALRAAIEALETPLEIPK